MYRGKMGHCIVDAREVGGRRIFAVAIASETLRGELLILVMPRAARRISSPPSERKEIERRERKSGKERQREGGETANRRRKSSRPRRRVGASLSEGTNFLVGVANSKEERQGDRGRKYARDEASQNTSASISPCCKQKESGAYGYRERERE